MISPGNNGQADPREGASRASWYGPPGNLPARRPVVVPLASTQTSLSRLLKTPVRTGCSKRSRCKAARNARSETYVVCMPQRRAAAPTPQMGLFQQPAKPGRHSREEPCRRPVRGSYAETI